MRLICLAVLALSLVACSTSKPAATYRGPPKVAFKPLPKPPAYERVNPKVTYVAGYEMVAQGTEHFDGLSDLQFFPADDGAMAAEAISDWGAMTHFTLKGSAESGFADSGVRIEPLRDQTNKVYPNKIYADAEDQAFDPVTGDRFVSFEGVQRVERFARDQAYESPGEILPLKGLATFPANQGMEGLAFVRDDAGKPTLLIGVESGGFWACDADGNYQCRAIAGPKVPGLLYKITSLAVLDTAQTGPKRDILALYRYYDPVTGPRNILTHLVWEGGALREDEVLFKVTKPLPIDNYEGVAPVKTAYGYRLYLIADVLFKTQNSHLLVLDWMRN